ncbi:hypothetical protein KY345_05950 [Candidatus Woesearchaeota archaeon]|nr:hypothetical protein [Candidatus Woesearchaeota archaeon]
MRKEILFLSILLLVLISGCTEQVITEEVVKTEVVIYDMNEVIPTDEMAHEFCLDICADSALDEFLNNRYLGVYECLCISSDYRYFDYDTKEELSKKELRERKEEIEKEK